MTGLKATGEVRALGAHIGGDLNLEKATLTNEAGAALNLDGARVSVLWLRESPTFTGILDITAAEIGDLVLDKQSGKTGSLPGMLSASGCQIRDVHGSLLTDWKVAEKWLSSRPRELGFTAQPWHEIAAVYDHHGRPADAQRLRFAAARRTTKQMNWWAKPPLVLYGLLVGHGYYPTRCAAAWLIAAFLLTLALVGDKQGAFVPTDFSAATSAVAAHTTGPTASGPHPIITGNTACSALTPSYQCLNAPLYALSTVLPTPGALQNTAWTPAPAWLAFLLAALKAFGWLMTVLLIAGLTGLLRKT